MVTSNQKVAEVVKLYVRQNKSHVIVIRMMQKKYSEDDRITKLQVHWLVNRYQQTESVEDCQHSNSCNSKKRDLTSLKRKWTSRYRFGVYLDW